VGLLRTAFGSGRLPVIGKTGGSAASTASRRVTLGDANSVNASTVASARSRWKLQRGVFIAGGSATIITQRRRMEVTLVTAFGINDQDGSWVRASIQPNAARNVGIVYDIGQKHGV